MDEASPAIDEWKALYVAAAEFKKLGPWNWISDTDIFGVQNHKTGEIGYCCIMGQLGEFLGMSVYSGSDGLDGYLKLQNGEVTPEDTDALYIQNCLMVSFENRSSIEKEDMKIINNTGLQFKGRKAWPLFRNYKPGYFPWFLNRDEALYMTDVLRQAKDMCLRLKENCNLLHAPKENMYLIRVAEAAESGMVWKDEWKEPDPLIKREYSNGPVDEIRVKRIKNLVKQTPAVWEIDSFYAPTPVKEKGRPYFPYAIMIADHDTGLIYDVHLAPLDKYMKDFLEQFLSSMENTSVVPMEILIRKEDLVKLFEPYTANLSIKLSKVNKLHNIDNARSSMMKFFSR